MFEETIETAFRKQRQSEQLERDHFLDWVQETAEAEQQAELRQRIRDLELENESLQESSEPGNADTKEEFDRDLTLSDEAEVLADMLAEEEAESNPAERAPETTKQDESVESD